MNDMLAESEVITSPQTYINTVKWDRGTFLIQYNLESILKAMKTYFLNNLFTINDGVQPKVRPVLVIVLLTLLTWAGPSWEYVVSHTSMDQSAAGLL